MTTDGLPHRTWPGTLMGVKMPRTECRDCGRPIAAGPVAGRLTKGRVWRHDPPGRVREPGSALVSCPGSLAIADVPLPARLLELPDEPGELDPDGIDTVALF
ncbi:hypothetical protein GCM10010300_52530 [Streptomyces olivaceoviridis]|uniref:hypothetical protein n=1 Tax=Streptomyces olivaceoviridis TaxID=1921 RepID=UPI001678481E|nr:hypothetical protein [Streptomyces olivaceoviridis]GGZ01966.1 hypothetical protein GCM10010300_52530 [Streptomyces olivaceoviridis]